MHTVAKSSILAASASSSPMLWAQVSRHERMLAASLMLFAFAAYVPALRGEFVFDDRHLYVLQNPVVHADDGLYRIWCTTQPIDFYPLTHTTYWFEWRLWETDTLGYHCFNSLLHGLTGIVVWRLLQRLGVGWAWLAAAIFVLHPLNVQAVAWISQRKSLLATLFAFASLLCYVRFDQERRRSWYWASVVLCAVAHLGKSSMLMMPFLLVGYHLWIYKRMGRRELWDVAPFFLLTLAFGFGGHWFMQHRGLQGKSMRDDNLFGRAATAGWSLWFYLYKTFVPVRLTLIYPRWTVDPWSAVVYLPGLALAAAAALCYRYRASWGRPLLAAFGFFAVTLFPILGFFDVGHFQFSFVADHYVYQSLPAITALVVGALAWYVAKRPKLRRSAVALSAGVLALLFVLTWKQSAIWASSQALWSDNVAKNPQSGIAHLYLCNLRFDEERYDEALAEARQAAELQPQWYEAANLVGVCLVKLGSAEPVEPWFRKAVALDPNKPEPYLNLGNLHRRTDPEAAASYYRRAIECDPWYAEAYNNLGALLARGRSNEAYAHYRKALSIDPNYADAHSNLGTLLARQGRIDEAIEEYRRALEIEPEHFEAVQNMQILQRGLRQSGRNL